jgi:hypothetical protein
MFIRKLAAPAAIAALGLLAVVSTPASASTTVRVDPGAGLLTGSTTITNTTSGPAVLTTGVGSVTCTSSIGSVTLTANSSATTIGGSLNTITFTSCTDTLPLITITTCHRHGASLPSIAINGSAATLTVTDVIVRCSFQGSNQGCYYTAASANGSANNAASTLTFTNVAVTAISVPTTDAVAPGACGTSGNFNAQARHVVQQGTNRTATLLP